MEIFEIVNVDFRLFPLFFIFIGSGLEKKMAGILEIHFHINWVFKRSRSESIFNFHKAKVSKAILTFVA